MSERTLIQAAWVAPMTGAIIPDGGVVVEGRRILDVGSFRDLRRTYPDAAIQDVGNAVVLPGLINSHTHLELSLVERPVRPGRFVDWLIQLMNGPIAADGMRVGIDQCIKFGVAAVGDITSQPGISRPVLAASNLSGISFGEVRAMGKRRGFLEPRLQAAVEGLNSEAIGTGISPHAPYSIERDGYLRCLHMARDARLPLTTHLAETADEGEFLGNHSGPFRELWDFLNAWDDQVPRFDGGPIRFANAMGLLDYPTLLAHLNYCDDEELNLLGDRRASVVYCPRTHAYFGHPPHRWREMLGRGINVAIGTDSCASSPDLNVVDDLRLVHEIAPEMEPVVLWEMITTRAAAALGLSDRGKLQMGNVADLVVFPTSADDPLREVLEARLDPSSMWIGGQSFYFGVSSPCSPCLGGD